MGQPNCCGASQRHVMDDLERVKRCQEKHRGIQKKRSKEIGDKLESVIKDVSEDRKKIVRQSL